jgi:phosphoribosylanthranilate isomerase
MMRHTVPSSFLIKICGLTSVQMVNSAVEAGADWVGFVHCPKSPRHVLAEQAAELTAHLRKLNTKTRSVLLMVDPTDTELQTLLPAIQPDFLQLHGAESKFRLKQIYEKFSKPYSMPLIKAVSVNTAVDIAAAEAFSPFVDYFLLDAKPSKSATTTGGNGEPFDWTILKNAPQLSKPTLLSGGLTPTNVSDALTYIYPLGKIQGVDVSSGVESARGVKDADKIRAFIHNTRATLQTLHNKTEDFQPSVTLKTVRQEIDAIDTALVQLLQKRMHCIVRAAATKQNVKQARIPSRIEDVVTKVRQAAQEVGFAPDLAENIWRYMIEQCIAQEELFLKENQ